LAKAKAKKGLKEENSKLVFDPVVLSNEGEE